MEENEEVLEAACFPLPDGNTAMLFQVEDTAVLFQVEDTAADDRLVRIFQNELAAWAI